MRMQVCMHVFPVSFLCCYSSSLLQLQSQEIYVVKQNYEKIAREICFNLQQLRNCEFYTSVLSVFYTISEMLHVCCIYHICQDTDTLLLFLPVTKHSLICIIMEEKKKKTGDRKQQ